MNGFNRFRARGHRVRAVSRGAATGPHDVQAATAGAATAGAAAVRADITRADGAVAACEGAAVVYQCAQPKYGRWTQEFPDLTRTVLAGAEAAGAKLVMADNLYVYGPVDGPLSEDLPHAAVNPKGRVRADVDELILGAHRSGRIRATLGRACDYYGPGGVNTVLGPNVFAAAPAGRTIRWIGELDQPHTVSYLPDIAAGLVTLGERADADGRAWHLPAAEPVTGRTFSALVGAEAGGEPRVAGLGRSAQRLPGGVRAGQGHSACRGCGGDARLVPVPVGGEREGRPGGAFSGLLTWCRPRRERPLGATDHASKPLHIPRPFVLSPPIGSNGQSRAR
ncbi:NAD-dependent epimerase/dehydratase family protein [Streptomyces sp. NPDC048484]|uniref:NAD-dependent epimerase/dehydratase family protein n=1 Tax=Streptomyces sp. NPDC048484 TaxID=3155146 RepID=UPI00341FC4C5